jgi:hypothetical protein
VIDSNTRTVIIPPELAERLQAGELVGQHDLMMHSVQMWQSGIEQYARQGLMSVIADSGMCRWLGAYDRFLGYMAGVIALGRTSRWDS